MDLISFLLVVGGIVFFPTKSFAHAFGQQYTLPVPLSFYLYGGAITLIVSFLMMGLFIRKILVSNFKTFELSQYSSIRWLQKPCLRTLIKFSALAVFIFTIIAGFIGVNRATDNINMTIFWIIFLLGFSYISLIFGNIWPSLNPLQTLTEIIEKNK